MIGGGDDDGGPAKAGRRRLLGGALLAPLLLNAHRGMAATPSAADPIGGLDLSALQDAMTHGRLTSEQLVQSCIARIRSVDPLVHAVLAIEPDALDQARASDLWRRTHPARALEGVPVLVKDNIEAGGTLPTTAGSLALRNNVTGRDAPIVARLRDAGAVILGKCNLSEWANMRGQQSVSGWSGLGGQTRNPYALDRTPSGSSSGSAVAVACFMAPLAIGTETDGSITMPASVCGLVGLKPTVGLLSRNRIIPISASQDTAGPIARTVADAARMLGVMAGNDPADTATAEADRRRTDYAAALDATSLAGKRIGVLRFLAGQHPGVDGVFARALERLKVAGAVLVEIPAFDGLDRIGENEHLVLVTELKTGLASYLAASPVRNQPQTLAELIRFNLAHADRELALFDQKLFEQAEATAGLDAPDYQAARADSLRRARQDGIEALLARSRLDALVAPTGGPAGLIDPVDGDIDTGSASMLPAVAGTPHLTVPMGVVSGLPVGLSFIGPAWSEALLLSLGYAFERLRPPLDPPSFQATLPLDAALDQPLGAGG